jgi:hypothetical protein
MIGELFRCYSSYVSGQAVEYYVNCLVALLGLEESPEEGDRSRSRPLEEVSKGQCIFLIYDQTVPLAQGISPVSPGTSGSL